MSRKKRKTNSLIKEVIKDIPLSGPSPDAELITVGQDMFWSPDNMEPIKKNLKENEDPMLNIL